MKETYNLQKMSKKLKKYMDEDRYVHTMGVMYTSAALAMAHGYDNLEKAQVAGLLHDCAKCIPNDKKLKLCAENDIEVTEVEEKNPFLLHAKLGALIANKKYSIEDESILSAITYHTTGRPHMTILDKIVFIADYIEPGRYKAAHLNYLRKIAFDSLDLCVYEILKDTLDYLQTTPGELDEMTNKAYLYYQEKIQKLYEQTI